VAQHQSLLVVELLALVGVGAALARRRLGSLAPERPGVVVALGAFGLTMVALYAAMTEAGFSGNARYVLPAVAAIAVLGGVGAAMAGDLVVRLGGGRHPMVGAGIAGTVLLLAVSPEIGSHVRATRTETSESLERSRLHSQLDRAVRHVGEDFVLLFGPPTVNRSFQTHLAWDLKLHLSDVQGSRGRGVVFRAPEQPVSGVVRVYARARRRVLIARVGPWTVSERSVATHVFTWPIEGFSLRNAAARSTGS
jgi:hypothetical protein